MKTIVDGNISFVASQVAWRRETKGKRGLVLRTTCAQYKNLLCLTAEPLDGRMFLGVLGSS